MTTYIKYTLQPGQKHPPGMIQTISGSEYFYWVGETEMDFNKYAEWGHRYPDEIFEKTYNYIELTVPEVVDLKEKTSTDWDKVRFDGIDIKK